MSRRTAPAPFVSLNRWQVTGAVFGVGAIVVVVFLIGVAVGRHSAGPEPAPAARIASVDAAERMSRHDALAGMEPGTRQIVHDLTAHKSASVSGDPADAARIETHRQLQKTRTHGVVGLDGPVDDGVAPVAPVAGGAVLGAGAGGYTILVSSFETQLPASMVAQEITGSGYQAHVRQVQDQGRTLWRVEVGQFSSPQAAADVQRAFETKTGTKTILAPTP